MCNSCSAPQTHKLSSNIQSTATDNKHSVTLLNLQSALSIGSKNVAELMEAPFYQYKIQRFFSLAHFKAALTPLYYVAPVVHKQIYHRARNSTRKLLAVIRHSTWRLLFRMSWLLQPGSAVGVVGCVARLDMTRYFVRKAPNHTRWVCRCACCLQILTVFALQCNEFRACIYGNRPRDGEVGNVN